ncbi:hypothetical protein LCGC14_2516110, partial [marine sediment metagenome]
MSYREATKTLTREIVKMWAQDSGDGWFTL